MKSFIEFAAILGVILIGGRYIQMREDKKSGLDPAVSDFTGVSTNEFHLIVAGGDSGLRKAGGLS